MGRERTRPSLRLDQLLVERGLAASRAWAQAMILAGEVVVGDHRADKPGARVAPDAALRLRARRPQYVSRAGAKLAAALDHFAVAIDGRVALDAGASTGGFVGVLLERGARRVYAVDVGYGQLDLSLQRDPRVTVLDRTNVRYLTAAQVAEPIDVVTLDLSFISLTKVLAALWPLVAPGGHLVCLVKPQFEVGRERIGKGGIVRDAAARLAAVATVRRCAEQIGFISRDAIESPLPGQKGNLEYLLALAKR
ncbi:MAG: TlyA family RNA methyltransferase [Deltaproteobacteria bacterium]|nr:TlyA family RNA methyltransferase [Deltaproteobacteria bacterium]